MTYDVFFGFPGKPIKPSYESYRKYRKYRRYRKYRDIGDIGDIHSKKNRYFTEPQKRFRRCLKVSKYVESLKKRIKISTKPLKVLPVCLGEEPSPAKPFFQFRTAEKGFIGKYETFRLSY
jgi:hypothetical protein